MSTSSSSRSSLVVGVRAGLLVFGSGQDGASVGQPEEVHPGPASEAAACGRFQLSRAGQVAKRFGIAAFMTVLPQVTAHANALCDGFAVSGAVHFKERFKNAGEACRRTVGVPDVNKGRHLFSLS